MKKVIYLLYFTLLMILYHFTRNTNMFLLTISFSLLLLFNSIFSTMNIKNKIQEYYDNKYYYFVADKNGKVYFSKTGTEHFQTINEIKSKGDWIEW